MSMAAEGEARHEIIIVRRPHEENDEHHGGVWKIAFADFMTAMMCFFLVMWLINAANEQTKSAVASYFNPVKLIDREASRKGLADLGDGPRSSGMMADQPLDEVSKSGPGESSPSSSKSKQTQSAAKASDKSDENLFADPYAVLSEIASDTGVMQNISQKGEGGVQNAGPATGASGGTSYRDPFAPDFWSQQVAKPGAEASAERARIKGDPPGPDDKTAEAEVPKVKQVAAAPELKAAPLEPLAKADAETVVKVEAGSTTAPSEAGTVPQPVKTPSSATVEAAAEVKRQLAEAFGPGDKLHDGVSVVATDKGVVIAITDQLDFGMFEIGSALPRRELVLAMDKIGRIINAQKGKITIQGHTDARPFKNASYDNWRLSSARAHSAYYMLVRGGVDERRITEVAGFADRQPKDAADPLSAVNRRIEILMETDG